MYQDGPSEERERACSGAVKETLRGRSLRGPELAPLAGAAALGAGRSDPMRLDLVARVRAEIAAGVYDTQEKWEIALDRLLARLELT
jgi:hypothetical protein